MTCNDGGGSRPFCVKNHRTDGQTSKLYTSYLNSLDVRRQLIVLLGVDGPGTCRYGEEVNVARTANRAPSVVDRCLTA